VEGFEAKGFTRSQAAELIRLSVRLVQEAREEFWENRQRYSNPSVLNEKRPYPLAAASVGPYGAYLADGSEYTGAYSADRHELADFHAERLALLLEAKPDILACETLPLFREAEAILDDLKKYPGAQAWVSFTCKDTRYTCGGDLIADCARFLDRESQVAAIGVNCTAPEFVADLIREIRAHTEKPVAVYPNLGETYDAADKDWKGESQPFSVCVKTWYEAGASLIGGCCRTTPEDIKGIAALRQDLLK
jgi:homocysteine S-methyltransferase